MGKQAGRGRAAADYLIASRRCEILCLEQLLRTSRLVVSASSLVHALQRERGASNMHLAAAESRFAGLLPALREDVDVAARTFRERLAGIDPEAGRLPDASRLFSRIAYALHGLEELQAVRAAVEPREVDSATLLRGYGELIRRLLAVVFEAADAAAEPDISRALVALFHLMQGKEFAGQERAVGAAGFAGGGFDAEQTGRLRDLIDRQERCLGVFASFADDSARAVWEASGAHPCPAELERLRRIAFAATGGQADPQLCEAWFDCASRRIDAMKEVEEQLEVTLEQLCERRIRDARHDLDADRDRVEALLAEPPGNEPWVVFAGDAPGGTLATSAAPAEAPRLGRSLAELVQAQSRRLEATEEALREARVALEERKTVEKAKGLLMRHRGLGEDDAYRFLRQLAMAQGRRLSEVAADTINMADIFRTPGASDPRDDR